MKIRFGFVSNSSSCSFHVIRRAINPKQFDHLRNHIAYAKLKKWDDNGWSNFNQHDSWDIKTEEDVIVCSTSMDNFDLFKFCLEVLDIPRDAIIDHYHSGGRDISKYGV